MVGWSAAAYPLAVRGASGWHVFREDGTDALIPDTDAPFFRDWTVCDVDHTPRT